MTVTVRRKKPGGKRQQSDRNKEIEDKKKYQKLSGF